jgi:hypothetical protein
VRPRDAFSSSDDERRFETVIMKGFRPLDDSVLIRRIDAEERPPGGTIVPDVAKEKPVEGEVLAFAAVARDDTRPVVPFASSAAAACCSASGGARR